MAMKKEGLVNQMVQKAKAQDRRNRDRMRQYRQLVSKSEEGDATPTTAKTTESPLEFPN